MTLRTISFIITFSIKTLSITKLNIKTLTIMTFGKTTLIIIGSTVTLGINHTY